VRDGGKQPAPSKLTLLDIFPSSPSYVSHAAWLEEVAIDASRALVGVRQFRSFPELLAKDSSERLHYVWQADETNFPAVDGVIFVRCILGGRLGPRSSALVAVLLQIKDRQRIAINQDILMSAEKAMQALCSTSDGQA